MSFHHSVGRKPPISADNSNLPLSRSHSDQSGLELLYFRESAGWNLTIWLPSLISMPSLSSCVGSMVLGPQTHSLHASPNSGMLEGRCVGMSTGHAAVESSLHPQLHCTAVFAHVKKRCQDLHLRFRPAEIVLVAFGFDLRLWQ